MWSSLWGCLNNGDSNLFPSWDWFPHFIFIPTGDLALPRTSIYMIFSCLCLWCYPFFSALFRILKCQPYSTGLWSISWVLRKTLTLSFMFLKSRSCCLWLFHFWVYQWGLENPGKCWVLVISFYQEVQAILT